MALFLLFPLPIPGWAATPAATIENRVKESDLTTVTLTPEAEKRLGIATVPVELRPVRRSRLFGGELVLPAGPASSPSTNGPARSVFSILPQLAPSETVRMAQAQVDAEAQVEQATVQVEAATLVLDRATQLLRDQSGPARAVDEARFQLELARSGLRLAKARRDLLGPPLLDLANPKVLWVRVPVYMGILEDLEPNGEARIGSMSGAGNSQVARRVAAPPSANAAASTVDLFLEVPNPEGTMQLGQRVGVTLPLKGAGDLPAVPVAALVHDAEGGTWVYESAGAGRYVRRRVRVVRSDGVHAGISGGPAAGAVVVVTGVAELFGTEFGAGK